MKNPLETIVNGQQLAKLFGVSMRQIQNLATRGDLPKELHGKYNLFKCVQAYIRYIEAKHKPQEDESEAIYMHEKALREKAEREIAEMKRDEMKGELIPSDKVIAAWVPIVANAKAKLLTVPQKSAVEITSSMDYHGKVSVIKKHVVAALNELKDIKNYEFEQSTQDDDSQNA